MEKLTSITLIDNIAQGTLCLRTVGCSSLHSRLPDIVGITLNALSAVGGMSAKQTCSHWLTYVMWLDDNRILKGLSDSFKMFVIWYR